MLQQTLEEIGLSTPESKCYITLLELGSSKTGAIVKKSGIPSSKIYEILERLMNRGFASYLIKNNVKHFQAADPKTIINYVEEKKNEIEQALPELLLKQKLSARHCVEMFEGPKAVFTLFTTLISDAKPKEAYLSFSIDEENKTEQANRFFRTLTLIRKEKKLDTLLLRNEQHYIKENHRKLKMRYTPIRLPQGITIFRNFVILLSWKDAPVAIKIESKTIAEQHRAFFMDVWKSATK